MPSEIDPLKNGDPLKHVAFSGSHFEIGVALGQLSAEAIRTVVPQIERVRVLQEAWAGTDHIRQMEAAARAAFPGYMREMDGIAEGAGVPFEDILIWNCRGDLPTEADPHNEGALGCTTVMSNPGGGAPITISHNEDGHETLRGLCALVTLSPDDATSITSYYYPGLVMGHNFGFNEYGLVQTVNNLRPLDQKIGLPRHIVSRASLASKTLDEAVSIFMRTDRASGFHYAIAQCGDDRLLSVEAPASGCVVREVRGRTAHANHLVFDGLSEMEQVIAPSSASRQTMADMLLSNSSAAPLSGLSIMGNTDNPDYPICLKLTDRGDISFTLATAEFEIAPDHCNWSVYDDPRREPVLTGKVKSCLGRAE